MAGLGLVSQSPGGAEHQPHLTSCSGSHDFCILGLLEASNALVLNSNLRAYFGTGWGTVPISHSLSLFTDGGGLRSTKKTLMSLLGVGAMSQRAENSRLMGKMDSVIIMKREAANP